MAPADPLLGTSTSKSTSALERPRPRHDRAIPPCRSECALPTGAAPRDIAVSEAMSIGMLSRLDLLWLQGGADAVGLAAARARARGAPDHAGASVLDAVQPPPPIGAAEALGHLIKGNLGAGCLALPLAFATVHVPTALGIFALVALQGTYSMLLLVRLKTALLRRGLRVHTFEDIGRVTFGALGQRSIEALVVVLQLGICCIYIALLRTNLHAGLGGRLSERACVAVVYGGCALLALLRDLGALWPLSTGANALMLCACVTAVVVSAEHLRTGGGGTLPPPADAPSARARAAAIARAVGIIYFAFEGIALVLPVENALNPPAPLAAADPDGDACGSQAVEPAGAPAADAPPADAPLRGATAGGADGGAVGSARSAARFERILLCAMCAIALTFVSVGSSVALAFPRIDSGSVTAFLAARAPDDRWLGAVNAFVSLACLLTFPLQMQPALLVLDRLAGVGRRPSALRFVCTRTALTASCAAVVLAVPALELLIALLGALCQASLAALPYGIALQLHRRGVVRRSCARNALHLAIAAMCACVCVVGSYVALADIAASVARRDGG
ncbi:hypothetical protein KFE25_008153 [Diacronema lutheri]|uniref:Amino acid transporter transmembrane domain-containing protein n=2 Tax=Diacronema lutheri TaxID=2081491 RepID=A0A8J5XUH4_DIALT|nr:hypothetical protein KFE25_008153 [Diacronema lutheri]